MSLQGRKLKWQQSLQDKLSERKVYSQKDLIAAISDFSVSRANLDKFAGTGRTIVFAEPFKIDRTIIIPDVCLGLKLRGLNRLQNLFVDSTLNPVFDIQAAFVTFADFLVLTEVDLTGTDIAIGPKLFARLNVSPSSDQKANSVTFDDVSVIGEQMVATAAGVNTQACRFLNCTFSQSTGTAPAIALTGSNHVLLNTRCGAASLTLTDASETSVQACTFGGITATGTGSASAFVGNDLQAGVIDTSASAGHNSIVSNYNFSSIVRNVTDAVAGNAP